MVHWAGEIMEQLTMVDRFNIAVKFLSTSQKGGEVFAMITWNHWWFYAVVRDLFRYLEEKANDTELSKIRKLYGIWNFLNVRNKINMALILHCITVRLLNFQDLTLTLKVLSLLSSQGQLQTLNLFSRSSNFCHCQTTYNNLKSLNNWGFSINH